MGHERFMHLLVRRHPAEDQLAGCEKLSFNPWRLVSGIEPSADPLLKARRDAYEEARKGRGVTQCPFLPK